jgi:hypothetical protein
VGRFCPRVLIFILFRLGVLRDECVHLATRPTLDLTKQGQPTQPMPFALPHRQALTISLLPIYPKPERPLGSRAAASSTRLWPVPAKQLQGVCRPCGNYYYNHRHHHDAQDQAWLKSTLVSLFCSCSLLCRWPGLLSFLLRSFEQPCRQHYE